MTLSSEDKEFVGLGASIGAGCHPCTQYHTQAALNVGVSAEQVLWAIEQAEAVRAIGNVAVANVGRRILGVEQEEEPCQDSPPCRATVLTWLGAAAGCNSGTLLARYVRQAAGLGLHDGELREAVGTADMVKAQAGRFLNREADRVLARTVERAGQAAAAAGCCSTAEQEAAPAGIRPGAADEDCGPGCGCENEQ